MKHILLGVLLGLTTGWLTSPPAAWYLLPLIIGVTLATIFAMIEQAPNRHDHLSILGISVLFGGLNATLVGSSWITVLILPGMVLVMLAWFHLATWGWSTYTTHHAIPPLWRAGWVGTLARTMRWVGAFAVASTGLLVGLGQVQPDLDTIRFLIVLTISSSVVRAITHDSSTIRGVIRLPRTRTP